MSETYTLHVAGLSRELPVCAINEHLSIAAFIMFSDVELTVACAKALLEKCPEFDVIVTAEAKGIPLAYEMSRQSGKLYIPARKGEKLYMQNPVVVEDQSITTSARQKLVIDQKERQADSDCGRCNQHRRLSACTGNSGWQEHRHRCWPCGCAGRRRCR